MAKSASTTKKKRKRKPRAVYVKPEELDEKISSYEGKREKLKSKIGTYNAKIEEVTKKIAGIIDEFDSIAKEAQKLVDRRVYERNSTLAKIPVVRTVVYMVKDPKGTVKALYASAKYLVTHGRLPPKKSAAEIIAEGAKRIYEQFEKVDQQLSQVISESEQVKQEIYKIKTELEELKESAEETVKRGEAPPEYLATIEGLLQWTDEKYDVYVGLVEMARRIKGQVELFKKHASVYAQIKRAEGRIIQQMVIAQRMSANYLAFVKRGEEITTKEISAIANSAIALNQVAPVTTQYLVMEARKQIEEIRKYLAKESMERQKGAKARGYTR